jgi:hypothetical protein
MQYSRQLPRTAADTRLPLASLLPSAMSPPGPTWLHFCLHEHHGALGTCVTPDALHATQGAWAPGYNMLPACLKFHALVACVTIVILYAAQGAWVHESQWPIHGCQLPVLKVMGSHLQACSSRPATPWHTVVVKFTECPVC